MYLLLFIITLIVSFIAVRIGAIAFQLTGLEWSLAKFQSLSCFTGTGFTTREAELIVSHPRRRRIASVLMVLGNAGLVTLILMGASSIIDKNDLLSVLSKSFLPGHVAPLAAGIVNLLLLIVAIFIVYKIFTNNKITLRLTNYLRNKILKREGSAKVSVEELLLATGGYGISRVTVQGQSPALGKPLASAGLRQVGINVLAIVRAGHTIANPGAQETIESGDELVCFGKLEDIRSHLCPKADQKITKPDTQ